MRVLAAILVLLPILAGTAATAAAANPNGIAVIVGNSVYEAGDIPNVAYAGRDADAIRAWLTEVRGFSPANIIDLRNASLSDLQGALGNDRTHKGRLFRKVKPGRSDVVVYYSGHGVPDPDEKTPYILPVNVAPQDAIISAYPLTLLYENLAKLKARSTLVLLDACFSGISHAGSLMGQTSPVYLRAEAKVPAGLTVLAASGPAEVATWDSERRQGLFTAHFLDGAKGLADRKGSGGNRDGTVTLAEVKAYLDATMSPAAMAAHRREQTASLAGDGAMVLARLAAPTAAIQLEPIDAPYRTVQMVRVRAAASVQAPALLTLPANATVWVAGKAGDWLRVQPDNGPAGYVLARHLRALPSAAAPTPAPSPPKAAVDLEPIDAEYVTIKNANVRDKPSVAGTRLATLPRGAKVAVLGKVKGADWYAIELADGRRAFVYKSLLADATRVAAATPPKPSGPATPAPAVGVFQKRPKPGDVFRDCDECPEMVVVPAGSFTMGSSQAERDWAVSQGAKAEWVALEAPQHRVTIPAAFAVGKFEVTKGQWARFVRETNHNSGSSCWTWEDGEWKDRNGRSWRNPAFSQIDSHPVVCVNWHDAKAYVAWLSRETGKTYRLLSEAEWEYVARAGTRTFRYWGDDRNNREGCRFANLADRTWAQEHNLKQESTNIFMCEDGEVFTSQVGFYRANGFGLYDMLGNVWEWVEDCGHGNYNGAPSDGSAWTTGGDCSPRVLRGGSWGNFPGLLRSADRDRDDSGSRDNFSGFRVARTLP